MASPPAVNGSITWLHLSDLHACAPTTGWDARRVLNALVDDLSRLRKDHGLRPQFIFFTGDLAFGQLGSADGRRISDQFTEGGMFLKSVCLALDPPIPPENVFIVPGNHDVNRTEVGKQDTLWQDAQTNVDDITGLIHEAGPSWKRFMMRLEDYRTWLETSEYRHLLQDPQRLIYGHVREVAGVKLGIAGLNSAWSCCRERETAQLWLGGRWQTETLLGQIDGSHVRLALIHHPDGWYRPEEGRFWRDCVQSRFDFCLHGHQHDLWVTQVRQHVTIAAGACYQGSQKPNGYNVTRYTPATRRAEIFLRRYDDRGQGVWTADAHEQTGSKGVYRATRLRGLSHARATAAPPGLDNCPLLSTGGCAFAKPEWITSSEFVRLFELAIGAALLLTLDRTPSGFWGMTYLHRRIASRAGVPDSGGSLTGTPFAIVAYSSLFQQNEALRTWLIRPLTDTLAKVLLADGNYRRRSNIGSVSSHVFDLEPLRHAAGGCLILLALGIPEPLNSKTIDILANNSPGDMAWDQAIVARSLLHALHTAPLKSSMRKRAGAQHNRLLRSLIRAAKAAPERARIWADPYDYGLDATNQSASVWALLPAIADRHVSVNLRSQLTGVIRQFLVGYAASAPDNEALLPNKLATTGRGSGKHVLATSISVLAWRTLETCGSSTPMERSQAAEECHKALRRIILAGADILRLPSEQDPANPSALEGYFGWAGLCLAAASCGITYDEMKWRQLHELSRRLIACMLTPTHAHERDWPCGTLNADGLIPPSCQSQVARAIENLTAVTTAVRPHVMQRALNGSKADQGARVHEEGSGMPDGAK